MKKIAVLSLVTLGLLYVGLIGTALTMDAEMLMSDCPRAEHSALCPFGLVDQISFWQYTFNGILAQSSMVVILVGISVTGLHFMLQLWRATERIRKRGLQLRMHRASFFERIHTPTVLQFASGLCSARSAVPSLQ